MFKQEKKNSYLYIKEIKLKSQQKNMDALFNNFKLIS